MVTPSVTNLIGAHKHTEVFSLMVCFQAVFDIDKEDGLTLVEIADGVTIEDIVETTEAEFAVAEDLKPMGQIWLEPLRTPPTEEASIIGL